MSDEQLRLMAQVLVSFIAGSGWVIPYHAWGINVGACRYCGAVGDVQYPDILYAHKDQCPILLCARLSQSLGEQRTDITQQG